MLDHHLRMIGNGEYERSQLGRDFRYKGKSGHKQNGKSVRTGRNLESEERGVFAIEREWGGIFNLGEGRLMGKAPNDVPGGRGPRRERGRFYLALI